MIRSLGAAALVLATAWPALAQEGGAVDRAGAEAAINTQYQGLMIVLDADARAKLQAAELKWIKYKDLDVALHAAWRGKYAADRRYIALTSERTEYLALAYLVVVHTQAGNGTFVSDRPYAAADKALNTAYGQAAEKLDTASRKKLLAAQLAWIGFRDAEATFWATWSRFSNAGPDLRGTCLSTVTDLRTRDLKQLVE